MPQNTTVPRACLISAPAPVAIISGITPKMKEKLVMRIGRRRRRAASMAASAAPTPTVMFLLLLGKFDDQHGVLHTHSRQHHKPDLSKDVLVQVAGPDRSDAA